MVLPGVSVSHEHLISFRMFSGARGISLGRDLGSKDFVLVSRMNPLFNGSISGGAECNAFPYTSLNVCSFNVFNDCLCCRWKIVRIWC